MSAVLGELKKAVDSVDLMDIVELPVDSVDLMDIVDLAVFYVSGRRGQCRTIAGWSVPDALASPVAD